MDFDEKEFCRGERMAELKKMANLNNRTEHRGRKLEKDGYCRWKERVLIRV